MNRVRLLILVWCTFISAAIVHAQESETTNGNGRITGTVSDSLLNTPVEFASVAIFDPNSNKPLNGTICDDKGKFTITKVPGGDFDVVISFIGFKSKSISIHVTDKRSEMNLGQINLIPSTKILNEVVVQGQKSLIEEKVDRTIYNAESDQTSKGGDATDVLKRVPLLTVDMDGNVSIRGSSSVKVLINNKPSTITANSVADALKQIPADMIKNVEVITSPSSKYDAEGSAGIINIILKKNTLEGLFVTVDGSAGTRGSNLSLNTNYRKGKMGFSFGAFGRNTYNVHGDFINTQQTYNNGDTVLNIQRAKTHSDGTISQYTVGWDYDINKLNSISVSLRYGEQNQNSYQDNLLTERYPNNASPTFNLKNVKTINISNSFDLNLTYTKAFSKKDREFNFLAIVSQNNPTVGFVSHEFSQVDNAVLNRYKNNNTGYTREITVQADFQEPITTSQLLEFGGKSVVRNVLSEYQYLTAAGAEGEYQSSTNSQLSNNFNYDQNVSAAYLSYSLTTKKEYSIKAGGRYEYTNILANFQGQSNINIPAYGVLVPSLNISKKLKNGNLLKASYNRRIQRPSLRDLNPNVQSSNPLNITIGNPNLKPEYADNFEIAYKTGYKSATLNLSTYVRYNTNDIQSARSVRNDTIVSMVQNIGSEGNYGASVFVNLPLTNNFSLNGGADFFYRILKNNSPDPFINATNRGLVQNYRIFGNYNFLKGWSIQFFSFFQGKNINLQGYRTNPINHSLSVKKDFNQKKGSIGMGVDNFATYSYNVYSHLNSTYLQQSTTNTLYNFIFKITLSYKIGKLIPEKKAKKSLEESDN